MSPCSFIPASKGIFLSPKLLSADSRPSFAKRQHISEDVWPSKTQRLFLSPPTVFHNKWVTFVGCNSVIHQTGITSVIQFEEVIQMEIVLNIPFPPDIFSKTVKLGTTNTTNFHLSSHVVTLCFLPVQVLPLSVLPHNSICNEAQNVFMLNAHTCISKNLPEQAG